METDIKPKVSVIVPIYGVEKYISACLESLVAQTYENFEVIIVDDGTKDKSAEIAQKFVDMDKRFTLVHRENGGLSAARNTGLENTSGEYVVYVDGDDAVTPVHLEKLVEAALKYDADIVCCSYACKKEDSTHIRNSKVKMPNGLYEGYKMKRCIIRDVSVRCYVWSKMWRKSLMINNGVTFASRYFEDGTYTPMMFYYADKIAVIDEPSYIYTIRSNSITGLTSERCVVDYLDANKELRAFYHSKEDYKKLRGSIGLLKLKVGAVAFCWVFVRIWRARTLKYSGRNLALIVKHYLPVRYRKTVKKQLEVEET